MPPLSAEATFRVDIARNFAAPEFEEDEYEAEISETMAIGEELVQVVATDADTKVMLRLHQYLNYLQYL